MSTMFQVNKSFKFEIATPTLPIAHSQREVFSGVDGIVLHDESLCKYLLDFL